MKHALRLTLTLAFVVASFSWPSMNYAQVATSYSGDALAATGTNGGIPFDIDHLVLPNAGGSLELSDPAPQSIPPSGCVGNCGERGLGIVLSTMGSGPESMSTAEVDQLNLTVGSHTITANIFSTTATASCPVTLGDKALVSSTGYVGRIVIDESVVYTNITDSLTFPLGSDGATVSVNNIASSTATSSGGDITINAIQIDTPSGDQIVVASSHAGVTCPKVTSGGGGTGGCKGKVTGGGVFMLNGSRQTFGLVAGMKKDGTAFGNVNYVNHGTGDHLQGSVESLSIDYSAVPPTATVSGMLKAGGAYTLVLTDAGEPGRADTFSLTSTPVNTGGPIALDPRGGNIQIHKGCGTGPSK